MSKLARNVVKETGVQPTELSPDGDDPNGPRNRCRPLYGVGDMEDWAAVDALRDDIDPETRKPRGWRGAQHQIDEILGISHHLTLDRFRRHWRRRCYCWPEDLRL